MTNSEPPTTNAEAEALLWPPKRKTLAPDKILLEPNIPTYQVDGEWFEKDRS